VRTIPHARLLTGIHAIDCLDRWIFAVFAANFGSVAATVLKKSKVSVLLPVSNGHSEGRRAE
jgi:hypothetical protein